MTAPGDTLIWRPRAWMIAYTWIPLYWPKWACAKDLVYQPGRLLQKDAGAFDFLAAQRAQEARNQPVHQLEIRRQRRGALVCVVEHLFAEVLRVHDGARAAVDEDELRLEDVTLALHVGPDRNDAPAAERVVHLFFALHDARARVRREHHRTGDDQRILVLLANLLPVLDVREDVLVRLEILGVLDGGRLVWRSRLRRLAFRLGLRFSLPLFTFPALGCWIGLRRLCLRFRRARRLVGDFDQGENI